MLLFPNSSNIDDLERHIDKHCVPLNRFNDVFGRYKRIYAWVLYNAFEYKSPIKYKNPKGAVIWVKLQ